VLGHLARGFVAPLFEDDVGAGVDLFDVVVHVFDEEDVVVQCFFVFGVCDSPVPVLRGHDGRGFFGDEFEALEHGFVDLLVRVGDREAHLERIERFPFRQHVLDGGGEGGECLDEADDAFALLDLDFGIFDPADLFVDEAGEQG